VAAVTFQGQQVKAPYGFLIDGTSAFTYVYSYTQAGLVTAKRLHAQFTFEDHGSYAPPDLEAGYTYDNEGRMLTLTYPLSGPTFTYGHDTMGRLNTLAQTAGTSGISHGIPGQSPVVTAATYGVANELLGFSGTVWESRLYNSLFQVTSITSSSGINMQYTYPTDGTNIGKISTQKNVANGEEVQYTYDALGRMISAQTTAASQGAPWGYSYNYDGFGNLNAKNVTKGSPLAGWAITADPSTNRSWNTDLNGNQLAPLQGTAMYDVENRLTSFGTDLYGYGPSNKRI
jgi:YD repeat-containing protein